MPEGSYKGLINVECLGLILKLPLAVVPDEAVAEVTCSGPSRSYRYTNLFRQLRVSTLLFHNLEQRTGSLVKTLGHWTLGDGWVAL